MKTKALILKLFLSIIIHMGLINCNTLPKNADKTSDNVQYTWQKSDTSIALVSEGKILWKLNYNRQRGKPYFAPLNTSDGQDLIWLRPDDHPWHYGLWFSWKYINHVNFWEEDRETSFSDGKALVESVSNKLGEDFSATIKMKISYAITAGNPIFLENRTLKVSAPDSSGNYYIDWSFDWVAQKDTVVLDRTPPEKYGGPEYGGYAGLAYRASSEMSQHLYRHANNFETKGELVGYGEKAEWMDLSGYLGDSKEQSGLVMFNHPENGDGDVPWYILKSGDFAFFNASLLFNRPITVLPDETIHLKYRTLIHSKGLSWAKLDQNYQSFIGSSKQGN